MSRVDGITVVCNEDLGAAGQFHAIALDDGLLAANGGEAGGIIQDKPLTGDHVNAVFHGESYYAAGAAVTVGALLTVAASGWLTTATSDDFIIGRALADVASGGQGRGIFNFASPAFY